MREKTSFYNQITAFSSLQKQRWLGVDPVGRRMERYQKERILRGGWRQEEKEEEEEEEEEVEKIGKDIGLYWWLNDYIILYYYMLCFLDEASWSGFGKALWSTY